MNNFNFKRLTGKLVFILVSMPIALYLFSIELYAQNSELKTLHPSESVILDIPPDDPGFIEIENINIDTTATFSLPGTGVVSQSASWQGREGRYILNLDHATGQQAGQVKIAASNEHTQPGAIRISWLYPEKHSREFALLTQTSAALHHHLYDAPGSREAAIEAYKDAIGMHQSALNMAYLADTYFNYGALLKSMDHLDEAKTQFIKSAEIYNSINERAHEASSLNSLGVTFSLLGKLNSALESLNTSLILRSGTNNSYYIAQTLNNIALTYWRKDDYQSASEYYEQSIIALVAQDQLSAAEIIKLSVNQTLATYEPSMVAATLNNLALTKSSLGQLDYAESAWRLARRLAEATGNRTRVAQIDQNLGKMYFQQGRLEQALEYLHQALAIHRELNNSYWIGETLTGIGNIYTAIDEHTSALDHYQQALDLNHDHQQQYANTLTQMAWSNWQLGHIEIAKRQFQQAFDSFTSSAQPGSAAVVASKYGMLQYQTGDRQQALAAQARSVAILDELGNLREAARARSRLGQMLLDQGRNMEAEKELQSALQAHRAVKDELFELDTLTALSRVQAGVAALNSAKTATELAGRIRGRTTSTDIQTSFAASRRSAYEQYINLLIDNGDTLQAWLVSEQIRARSLSDLMQQSSHREHRLANIDQPVNLLQLQQQLGHDTTLLSYFLGAERSHLWMIGQNDVRYHGLPPAAQINDTASALAEALRHHRQSPSRIAHIAGQLGQMVLPPVSEHLRGRQLVISPDGGLQTIPFALLPLQPATANLLVASRSITYTPSARIFSRLSRQPLKTIDNILVLADPLTHDQLDVQPVFAHLDDRFTQVMAQRSATRAGINLDRLPGASMEAAAIQTMVRSLSSEQTIGTTLRTGEQASHHFVTSAELRDYDVIHFATHGIVDADVPALSGLVLAKDARESGYLRPDDIAALQLNAGLVVLSGCETGIGKSIAGEGLMSLSRPFLIAGARQVISSLWKVSDRATAELMERFYFHLLQEHQSPQQALQSAQQWMHEQPQWQHPNFWAGFVLTGA